MTYKSPLHKYWPLTRAMLIVEADAETVAKACYDFHRSRYIHPEDKVTKYTLSEFSCVNLSESLQRLLPISIAINTNQKFLVLPTQKGSIIIQNSAKTMVVDVIKRLKVQSYIVRCDGQLADDLPIKRFWGLYSSKNGSTINAQISGENPPSSRIPFPHEIKQKKKASKFFGFDVVPELFTDTHVLEALQRLGHAIHDPEFYLSSSEAIGFEITRVQNINTKPEFEEIELLSAKNRWIKNGTLFQKK